MEYPIPNRVNNTDRGNHMNRWPEPEVTEARILKAADRLFYRQGIRAVGVDAIAAEIGISKRTLYNYFPSKDALVLAYLRGRAAPTPVPDEPPAAQVLAVFDRLGEGMGRRGWRGCPFVNAVTELGHSVPGAREIAAGFKEGRRASFQILLERAGAANPASLAAQLMLLVDGAIAAALVSGDAAAARTAREAAAVLLAAAGITVPPAAGR